MMTVMLRTRATIMKSYVTMSFRGDCFEGVGSGDTVAYDRDGSGLYDYDFCEGGNDNGVDR
eukprot:7663930-Pyramimonas_sp.AAC.2